MITSIFKKSSIVNYALVILLLLVVFFLYQNSLLSQINPSVGISSNILFITLLITSVFLVNFIVKKNGLTKNSSYAILFFLLYLMLFPSVFSNSNLLFANFFILLAMRRLISLQTLKAPKEKIFDASMWIFIASLFHFWCILFILMVYISIIFHVSRDYRNWLLPFVAFATIVVIFLLMSIIIDITWISHIRQQTQMDFEWDYFTNNFQNAALSFYVVAALYFLLSMILTLTNKPLILQASYKKMVLGFIIGSIVFILSPNKNNAMLMFTFFPLAVMTTNNIEYTQNKLYQEIVLVIMIIGGFVSFFGQL